MTCRDLKGVYCTECTMNICEIAVQHKCIDEAEGTGSKRGHNSFKRTRQKEPLACVRKKKRKDLYLLRQRGTAEKAVVIQRSGVRRMEEYHYERVTGGTQPRSIEGSREGE